VGARPTVYIVFCGLDTFKMKDIAPNFSDHQKRAIHPKLPFELWEVKMYGNNLVSYNRISPITLCMVSSFNAVKLCAAHLL